MKTLLRTLKEHPPSLTDIAWALAWLALLCLSLLCSSCTYTDGQRSIALGGKGLARGSDYLVIWNNEKSFRDGSMLAGVAVGAWQSVAASKAAGLTDRAAIAAEAKNHASDNALKEALGAQEVEKANFVPPTQ